MTQISYKKLDVLIIVAIITVAMWTASVAYKAAEMPVRPTGKAIGEVALYVGTPVYPQWFNQSSNVTAITPGQPVLLSVFWNATGPLNYSWLQTNETGTWATRSSYGSPMALAGNSSWSNFTWDNDSVPAGTVIGWRVFANSSQNDINFTDTSAFTVQAAAVPEEEVVTPAPSVGTGVRSAPAENITVITELDRITIIGDRLQSLRHEIPVEEPSNVAINGMAFTLADYVTHIEIIIEISDRPEGVPGIGDAVQYLNVSIRGISEEEASRIIKDIDLDFKVEKDLNIREGTVLLNRYNEGWRALPTTMTGETSEAWLYRARSPGLSIFAVTGERTVEPVPQEEAPVPLIPYFDVTLAPMVIVLVIVAVLLFIITYDYMTRVRKRMKAMERGR